MKPTLKPLVLPALGAFLFLAGCSQAVLPDLARLDLTYSILTPKVENGSVRVQPDSGIAGTQINVYVNPAPGYVLREKSLRYYTTPASYKELEKESLYQFLMPSNNIWVTADFDEAPKGINTVTLDETEHGNLIASPLYGTNPTPVVLTVLPESGYGLKSLIVRDVDGNVNASIALSPPYQFTLSGKDVIVKAEFEKKGVNDLVSSGRAALSIGEYDAAYAYYEAAFQQDAETGHADKEAVFYATLGKLGSILTDLQVRKIFRNCNMSIIPDSLNGWVCDTGYLNGKDPDRFKWYMEYANDIGHLNDKGYYSKSANLPRLSNPQGYPSGFLNFNIVHQGSYDHPVYGKGQYRRFWDSLLFYNLISSNRNGFNDLVDDILQNIFGSAFEEAASRLVWLDYRDTITLNQRLIDRFDLERFFGTGPDVQVGRAELDIIFAYLRTIKAGFEYLASYNLEADLTPMLISGISDDDSLNEILAAVFRVTLDPRLLREGSGKSLAGILPLRNLFLRTRDSQKIAKSKEELTAAVKQAKTAFDYYAGGSNHLTSKAQTNINDHLWIPDGLGKLQTALANGAVFSIPNALPPAGQSTWPGPIVKYEIRTDKFFNAGNFSIDKLIVTENSGRRPVFFGLNTAKTAGERIAGGDQFDQNTAVYSGYTFAVNTGYLQTIFTKGFEQYGDTAMFNQVAPMIVLWKGYDPDRKPTYFRREIAEKLYNYYQR